MEPSREARPAHEFVRRSLRRAIMSGELPMGRRLVQSELAQRFDVSNTPVREALRDLAGEGLVRMDAYRGAIVQELDLEAVNEIYMLRGLLEPVAIRRASEFITEAELAQAQQLIDRMDVAVTPADWVTLNYEFHGVFAAAARAPRLKAILDSLRSSSEVYIAMAVRRSTETMRRANVDHRALVDALRRGDVEAAVATETEHLERTRQALEDANLRAESGATDAPTDIVNSI